MTPTDKTTDSIRNDLWSIRDKITVFQTKHRDIDISSHHYDVMCEDVIEAAKDIDNAIYAINIVMANGK